MDTVVVILQLLLFLFSLADAQNATKTAVEEFHMGVVLDLGTVLCKIALTSISLAMEDFYAAHPNYTTRLTLQVRDSMTNDVQAASAGSRFKLSNEVDMLCTCLFNVHLLLTSYKCLHFWA
ncbi:hypothetical protein BAE44_0014142 [Dichanthelium oligosanthes]|uniref:Uncharacterized protein n=1 Tax=Dichanthelium oligosanthes TaxID=888268 RepID=A0A1E5VI85_9POAL|nr:hypothetical protein BAE44_0014142 [Dichanthelium oligosanthes]